MKVKEILNKLKDIDPDMEVYLDGGFINLIEIETVYKDHANYAIVFTNDFIEQEHLEDKATIL